MHSRSKKAYQLSEQRYSLPDEFPVQWVPDYRLSDNEAATTLQIHNVMELGYCREGAGVFIVDEKILPFKRDDIFIVNNREWHRAQSRKGTSSRWSWLFLDAVQLLKPFSLDFAVLDISRFCGKAFTNIFGHEHDPGIHRIGRDIFDEMSRPGLHHPTRIRALVLALLTGLHRQKGLATGGNSAPTKSLGSMQRITPALEYLRVHYAEKVLVETLAKTCCMSVPTFRRQFTASLGKSPQEYLLDTRVTMACVELRETDKSVERIAWGNGFPELSNFERKFKSTMGVSPGVWRKS
jgi:AraC-like DNA-binding protein